ncbi:MAG: hypothetical protein ABIN97_16395 [Ginsengibacter sp.]
MHVLTCDTSTVDKWLDTSNHIENIILQFNTISLKKTSRHMNVVCYALTNSGYYFDSVPNELVKTEKFSKKINGTAIFGNNVFTTNQLKDLVFDALGHKVVYDYLTFTPYIDINKHIYYLVSASRPPAAPSPPPITSAARTEPCPPAVCATKIGNVQ